MRPTLLYLQLCGLKLSVRWISLTIYYFLGLTAKTDERNLLQRDNDDDSNLVIAEDIFNSMNVSSGSTSPASPSRERCAVLLI